MQLAHIHDRMMYDTFSETRRRDDSWLGVTNRELSIPTNEQTTSLKLKRDASEIHIQVRGELLDFRVTALAATRQVESSTEVFAVKNPIKQSSRPLHLACPNVL